MSAPFNVTQATIDAVSNICQHFTFTTSTVGLLNVGISCAPLTATLPSDVFCVSREVIAPVATNDCPFIAVNLLGWTFTASGAMVQPGTVSGNMASPGAPAYDGYCSFVCQESLSLLPRGLPNEEVVVTSSASTLHPFNFTITLVSLLVVVLMFFKRSH